jgi:NAD+ synthase
LGPIFKANLDIVKQLLVGFIQNEVYKMGFKKVVLGLSGGVDSSLCAYLAAAALGPENVLGIMMPYKTSNPESIQHAQLVIEQLGIRSLTVDITPMIDVYFQKFAQADHIRRGNKMARERMTILYDQSAAENALVLGTSNKTELLLGYGTLFGDMASALNPIGDLYKTQVRLLARYLEVPPVIIEKKPSADLWLGQSDEEELGFSYDEVDEILYYLVDKRYSCEELIEKGYAADFVYSVYQKVQNSQFKRRMPIIAKVSERTIDRDFRYSRDWGR